jgi:hypothetical protein
MSSTKSAQTGHGHGLVGAAKALSGSTLGILALALLLVDAILGIVAGSGSFDSSERHWLTAFVITFPFVVIAVFVYLARSNPLILVPFKLVRNQREYLKLVASRSATPLPPSPEPWRDAKIYEADKLTGGSVTQTTLMTLFGSLSELPQWDYIVVDIESGRRWLISRLFIFTLLLKEMLGLRCVVFVESARERRRKLLGITTPGKMRQALSERYRWFDDALLVASKEAEVRVFGDGITLAQAEKIMRCFIGTLQDQEDHREDPEWSILGDGPLWERSPWLDGRVVGDLSPVLYDRRESSIRRASRDADFGLYTALMTCKEPFAAVINDLDEFQELYDKQAIVNRFAEQMNVSIAATPSAKAAA